MKAFRNVIMSVAVLYASFAGASGQVRMGEADGGGGRKLEVSIPVPVTRFSGAVETGSRFFFGEKAGKVVFADAVVGFMHFEHLFLGLGLEYDRYFIVNSQYIPAEPPANVDFYFGWPKILKGNEVSLFLDLKNYWGTGRLKPTIEGRAGSSFADPGLGGRIILSFGAGCRYDLTQKTGIALRAFYEFKDSYHGDDFYDSEQGVFQSAGVRISYEF